MYAKNAKIMIDELPKKSPARFKDMVCNIEKSYPSNTFFNEV